MTCFAVETCFTDKHMKLAEKNAQIQGLAQCLASCATDHGVTGSRPGRVVVRCDLLQVTFTPYLVLVKSVRLTLTDFDAAGDNVVPNALSQRDIVSIPDSIDETVLHTRAYIPY